MVLVLVGIEAAVDARRLIVVVAFAIAVVADLAHAADVAALATIELVPLQVDAGVAAGVGVTNAYTGLAVFFSRTGLVAAAAVRWIGLWVYAGVVAGQQHLAARGYAVPLGTKFVACVVAAATMVRIGAGVDACVSTCGLALLAHEATLARHADSIASADIVACTTVMLGALRVHAKIIADHIGRRTYGVAHPVDAELVDRASDAACATVLGAGVRDDTAAIAEHLMAQAVEHASPVFTHLVIQATLPTAATVQDVQLNVDTLPAAAGLPCVEADLGVSLCIVTVRELGVRFPASARPRNQREQQDKTQLLWKCQRVAGITSSMYMPEGTRTAALTALHERFFSCRKSMRGGARGANFHTLRSTPSRERDP